MSHIDRWLVRILLVLVAGLVACSAYVVWTIARITNRVEAMVANISEDVSRVTSTAGRMASKVDEAVGKIDQLEARAKDTIQIAEMEHMIDEFAIIQGQRRLNEKQLGTDGKEEIKYLLNCVRASGCRFGHENDIRSASNYYIRLYSKFKLYEDALASPEDFIRNVATNTVGGNEYFIVLKSGQRQPLADWLLEKLKQSREKKAGGRSPSNENDRLPAAAGGSSTGPA